MTTPQGMLADADKIDQLRIERDLAQSACTAWRDVFEGIEAHLQDRIAMRDQSSPETYLSIIRSAVENVYRDSQTIVNSRWADSACSQKHIARLEQELAEARQAAAPDGSEVNRPLASRCFSMSEPYLSGWRLVIGFNTREEVNAAQEYVARLPK